MITRKRASMAIRACSNAATLAEQVATRAEVQQLFQSSGILGPTITKGGWCLQEGLTHILTADQTGRLLSIVKQHGLPNIYDIVQVPMSCRHDSSSTSPTTTTVVQPASTPQNCFQSLCRIIAGQQLAGAAARAMWVRLLHVVSTAASAAPTTTNAPNLNPGIVLHLAEQGVELHLQKPSGLSRAKAASIVALATAFESGELTEDFLIAPTSTEADIQNALLPIKGIGPWTCDMFLMFYLEKGNVMPLGDLGVRKGIAKFFNLTGRGPKQSLCPVKDKDVMERILAPFEPYQSLVAYYMWAVVDTKDIYREDNKNGVTLEVDTYQSQLKTKRKRKA